MKNKATNKQVAIVCDWLNGIGGAERVVYELHKLFPDAPIITSQYDIQKINWFGNADVRTTWLQKLPKSLKKFLPVLRAISFSHINLRGYDLIISSSGAEAKGVKARGGAMHISYCHSPTHYYWTRYEEYLKNPGFGAFDWLARIGLKLLIWPMRRWDYKAAQRPNYLIANSNYTKANIQKYYNRDSVVIHPPVDVDFYKNTDPTGRHGFVVVGRQTPYKRIDLAVRACTALGLDLVVIGNGPDHQKLRQMAGQKVQFIKDADDVKVASCLMNAAGFIFPGVDDFGIAAVEAMAAGTPVIAYKAGGALDYVNENTGLFFESQTVESLAVALKHFQTLSFNHKVISDWAGEFSNDKFKANVTSFIDQVTATKPAAKL